MANSLVAVIPSSPRSSPPNGILSMDRNAGTDRRHLSRGCPQHHISGKVRRRVINSDQGEVPVAQESTISIGCPAASFKTSAIMTVFWEVHGPIPPGATIEFSCLEHRAVVP